MNKSKYFISTEKVEGYCPPNHERTTNYRLAGKGVLDSSNMEIIFAELSKGGEAKIHSHTDSEQAIFVLEGSLEAEVSNEKKVMGPHELVYIPVNTEHRLTVLSEKMRCLVLYSPQLKDW